MGLHDGMMIFIPFLVRTLSLTCRSRLSHFTFVQDGPSIRGARFRAPVPPSSPTKHVPAAPVIQIPLLSSSARMAAAAHEIMAPSAAGLPYDNATFSTESADEDGRSNSSGESVYGHRVLTIDELHTVLVEDPRLAQRLSLERDYNRLEDVHTESPSGTSRIRLSLRQSKANLAGDPLLEQQPIAPSSPSYGGSSENRYAAALWVLY